MPEYRFDEIAILRNEKRTPVPEDKYTYVGLEHLDSGKLEVTRWGSEVDIKGEKLVMHKGDILFGRRNTYLKRAAIAPHDGLFSAHGMIFRPNTKVISERLFPFFIASDYFMDAAIRISVGSLSPTVNWKTLRELRFKLPPLDQQNELADLMQAANDTKVAYEQMLLQLDELVKSQFIEMFGDLKTNSKSWVAKPLRELCDISRGGSPRPIANYLGGTIPWIKIGDATDGDNIYINSTKEHIIEAGVKKSRYVKAGSLIFANCGVSLGFCRIINFDGCIHDGWLALQDIDEALDKVFLLMTINQQTEYFRSIAPGSTQPNLNTEIMGNYLQIVPPMELQKEYIEFVYQSDKSKFELKQAIERVTNLMKSLMQQDFAN